MLRYVLQSPRGIDFDFLLQIVQSVLGEDPFAYDPVILLLSSLLPLPLLVVAARACAIDFTYAKRAS